MDRTLSSEEIFSGDPNQVIQTFSVGQSLDIFQDVNVSIITVGPTIVDFEGAPTKIIIAEGSYDIQACNGIIHVLEKVLALEAAALIFPE